MSSPSWITGSQGSPRSPATGSAAANGPLPAQRLVPAQEIIPGPSRPPRWQRRFRALVVCSDIALVALVTLVAVAADWSGELPADRAHLVSGLIGAVLLVSALPLARAWDTRLLGTGTVEFKRLMQATIGATVVLAFGGLTLLVDSVRIWVFLLLPLTGLFLAAGRFTLRKWLHGQRRTGRCSLTVLAVGNHNDITGMIRRTRRDPYFGWLVTGAATPTGRGPDGSDEIEGVPVVGDLDAVGAAARSGDYQIVAVCRAAGWGAGRLHQLAWELEATDADLAVDPGLMEIAGPRMHIAPIDGLPLLRLTKPRFTGASRALKTVFDRVLAATLLLLTAPVLIALAVAVRIDGGPAFFRQQRVGAGGRTFTVYKFRSMVVDAETRLAQLEAHNEVDGGTLFKMRNDPRVTRVGAFLRRYSLDELPQLVNVLNGTMSLVGPRPPLPSEVATYQDMARRRLLVRPGMTGLWQVSGRSDLSWEESIRLDLRYVENWSMALDFTILWKTVGAVIRSHGAY